MNHSNDTRLIFDRKRLLAHKRRAHARFGAHDFLFREAAERLAERLDDMARHFPLALEIGSHGGILRDALQGHGGIETLIHTAIATEFLPDAAPATLADHEFLPFCENAFDIIMSTGALHWVNDVPGMLAQICRALKPDGLFIAIFPGGDTLHELRESLAHGALAAEGGTRPYVSPFIDVRDAGHLLQRAGFALPVVDSDCLTVTYRTPLALMHDLRGMGETNALRMQQRSAMRRETFAAACAHYQTHFPDNSGGIRATIELITLTGWKPHASQQKPAPRGSGTASLKTALS